jgi:hypothetical protein
MPRLYWHPAFTLAAALLVWATLALRLTLAAAEAQDQNPVLAMLDSFRYFTVLTTLLIALALTAPRFPNALRAFNRPDINTLLAASILLVALVYAILLRDLWQPQGLRKVVDVLLHYIIPTVFIVYWWLAVDKQNLRWRQIPAWLLYPVIYVLAVLLRGLFAGDYPYPFIDVAELGYLRVLFNVGGLLALYGGLCAGLMAAARWKVRLRSSG